MKTCGSGVEAPGRRRTPGTKAWMVLGALAAVGAAVPAQAAAQDVRVERQECRCVDRNGNEIENCTCIRSPRILMEPARVMIEGLRGSAFFRRGQIGVWVESDEDEPGGALISEVREDGPAEEAGMLAGDLVLSVNGRSLQDPLEEGEDELDPSEPLAVQRFVRMVGELEPGEEAEIRVRRGEDIRTLTVVPEEPDAGFVFRTGPGGEFHFREGLGELPERMRELGERVRTEWEFQEGRGDRPSRLYGFRGPEDGNVFRFDADSLEGLSSFTFFGGDPCMQIQGRGEGRVWGFMSRDSCVDGVEFLELNEDLASYFDAPAEGVLVTEVAEESTLGLRAGDVVLAIDGRSVRDPDHARRILSSYETDEEVRLRVIREGREIEVLGRRRGG